MVREDFEAVKLFVYICSLGKLSWLECSGWINNNKRKRTSQEDIKVTQVKSNKGVIRMRRDIAEVLFNWAFIQKYTEHPSSWTQTQQSCLTASSKETTGVDTG